MCHTECLKNALEGLPSKSCGTRLLAIFEPLNKGKKFAKRLITTATIVAEMARNQCEREAVWLYFMIYVLNAEKSNEVSAELWHSLNDILQICVYCVAPLNYGYSANVLNFSYLAELMEILEPAPTFHNTKLVEKIFLAGGLRWLEILNYLSGLDNPKQRDYLCLIIANIMNAKYPERVPVLIAMVSKDMDDDESAILLYKLYMYTLNYKIFRNVRPDVDLLFRAANLIKEVQSIAIMDYVLTLLAAIIDRPNLNDIIRSNNLLKIASTVIYHCRSSMLSQSFTFSDELRGKLDKSNTGVVIDLNNSLEIAVMIIGERVTLPTHEMRAAFKESTAIGDATLLIPHFIQYLSSNGIPCGLIKKSVLETFGFYTDIGKKIKMTFINYK
jgi:hypothetical protein